MKPKRVIRKKPKVEKRQKYALAKQNKRTATRRNIKRGEPSSDQVRASARD